MEMSDQEEFEAQSIESEIPGKDTEVENFPTKSDLVPLEQRQNLTDTDQSIHDVTNHDQGKKVTDTELVRQEQV